GIRDFHVTGVQTCALPICYYIMSPVMISFLANYQISDMIVNEFDITSYVGTIVGVVFGSGILFQLPVVIFFLTKVGIVTPTFLRSEERRVGKEWRAGRSLC